MSKNPFLTTEQILEKASCSEHFPKYSGNGPIYCYWCVVRYFHNLIDNFYVHEWYVEDAERASNLKIAQLESEITELKAFIKAQVLIG